MFLAKIVAWSRLLSEKPRMLYDPGWQLTIHSSRSRFAARLNSGVRFQERVPVPKINYEKPFSLNRLFVFYLLLCTVLWALFPTRPDLAAMFGPWREYIPMGKMLAYPSQVAYADSYLAVCWFLMIPWLIATKIQYKKYSISPNLPSHIWLFYFLVVAGAAAGLFYMCFLMEANPDLATRQGIIFRASVSSRFGAPIVGAIMAFNFVLATLVFVKAPQDFLSLAD